MSNSLKIIQGGMGVQVRHIPLCRRSVANVQHPSHHCIGHTCSASRISSGTCAVFAPVRLSPTNMLACSQPVLSCAHIVLLQVSSWKLAREVARSGELGIISGTAMDVVVLRWLQDGDPGNLYRNALSHFPDQGMVKRFIDKYYVEGGKAKDTPYKPLAMWTLDATQELREACVLGNFCEVGVCFLFMCSTVYSAGVRFANGSRVGWKREWVLSKMTGSSEDSDGSDPSYKNGGRLTYVGWGGICKGERARAMLERSFPEY